MKEVLLLSCFLIASSLCTQSQSLPVVDSLVHVIEETDNDSLKAYCMIKVGSEYERTGSDSALGWYQSALLITQYREDYTLLDLSGLAFMRTGIFHLRHGGSRDDVLLNLENAKHIFQKSGNRVRLSDVLTSAGLYECFNGNQTAAFDLHSEAINILQELKDTARLARSYNNLGLVYYQTNDIENAILTYQKALEINEALQQHGELAKLYSNIGALYAQLDYHEKSRAYFQQGLNLKKAYSPESEWATAYNNLGSAHRRLGNSDSAIALFEEAIELGVRLGNPYVEILAKNNYGLTYYDLKQYDDAYKIVFSALEKAKAIDHKPHVVMTLTNLSMISIELGNYKDAIELSNEAILLTDALNNVRPKISLYSNLSDAYNRLGNSDEALRFFTLKANLSDSLNSASQKEALLMLDNQYHAGKQKREIEKQKLALLKQDADAKTQQAQIIALVSVLLLVLIILIFILREYRVKTARNESLRKTNQHIVEQKDQIEEQREALKRSNSDKDKLFSIVSHDLRGPFNSLKMILDLSASGDLNHDEIQILLQKLNKSVGVNHGFLENLLLWSKSQLGGLAVNKSIIALNSLSIKAIETFDSSLKEKDVRIDNGIDERLRLHSDPDLILILMRNLIGNAIKFSHQGGKIILRAEKNDYGIEIKIQDYGVGIQKDKIAGIFELSHESTLGTEKEVGTGLGLTLCKEVATKLGGSIAVESEVNKGTTVIIRLPE